MNKNLTGKRIRNLRQEQVPPMSQAELAHAATKLGAPLNQDTVSLIENGLRSVSDIELVAIARCFKVPAAELLGERNSPR